ncbi:MAG: hypothetical protein IT177_20685 [Acidobacteria bacterium]|nr:hypothetical protein [Acidobacteriota bacterium]
MTGIRGTAVAALVAAGIGGVSAQFVQPPILGRVTAVEGSLITVDLSTSDRLPVYFFDQPARLSFVVPDAGTLEVDGDWYLTQLDENMARLRAATPETASLASPGYTVAIPATLGGTVTKEEYRKRRRSLDQFRPQPGQAQDHLVVFGRAFAAYDTGDFATALPLFETLMRAGKADEISYGRAAWIHEAHGNMGVAEAYYHKAAELSRSGREKPAFNSELHRLCAFLGRRGDRTRHLQCLQQCGAIGVQRCVQDLGQLPGGADTAAGTAGAARWLVPLPWAVQWDCRKSNPGRCFVVRFEGLRYETLRERPSHDGIPMDEYWFPILSEGRQVTRNGQQLWGRLIRLPASDHPDQSDVRMYFVTWRLDGGTWVLQDRGRVPGFEVE